jgi:hypothetical protein
VREVLPAYAVPSDITEGGAFAGGAIEWSLSGVATKTLGYRLSPAACLSAVAFPGSSWKVGEIEALIGGTQECSTAAPADEALGAWTAVDIGTTGGASQPIGDHGLLMLGPGSGVKLTKDACRFVHRAVSGDFELSARIDCMPGGTGNGGLMVRGAEDQDAPEAFLCLYPSTTDAAGLKILARKKKGQSTVTLKLTDTSVGKVASFPIWLKVTRAGTTLSFLRSSDGSTYVEAAKTDIGATALDLGAGALAGLAATGNGTMPTRFSFLDVSGPGFRETVRAFRRGDAKPDGKLDLTDAIVILGWLFQGAAAEPSCLDAADANDDGKNDLSDAIVILGYLFQGTAAIPAPGPTECGPDTTPSERITKPCEYAAACQ